MIEVVDEIEYTKTRLIETTRAALDRTLSTLDPLAYSQSLVDQILVLEVEVESMPARIAELEKVVDSYAGRLSDLPNATLQLARLERDKRVNENIYTLLLQTYEEARIAEAREMGEVRVIDRADLPSHPISPNTLLNLAIGVVIGLGVGLVLTFAREHTCDAVDTVEDVERETSLQVLGVVPEFGRAQRSKAHHGDRAAHLVEGHLVTHQEAKSPVAEAYRALRTSVEYSGENGPPRSLVITSPGPAEGKSTTVTNLAISMARNGTSVVLVDSDLRRSVIHSILHLDQEPGLSELLLGEASISDVVQETDIPNLSVVASGSPPQNPSELLGSQAMTDAICGLSSRFECALFDVPPILLVTDAAVVAAKTEGVGIVVRLGHTGVKALARTQMLLERVRAKVMGVVINQAPRGRGYGDYYHPYYHRYYGESSKSGRRSRKRERTCSRV
jgi:tyrosine-protein kinase Etk/Wzc